MNNPEKVPAENLRQHSEFVADVNEFFIEMKKKYADNPNISFLVIANENLGAGKNLAIGTIKGEHYSIEGAIASQMTNSSSVQQAICGGHDLYHDLEGGRQLSNVFGMAKKVDPNLN